MSWLISQALMKDYENSHCSLAQAEESSEVSCSDGKQSVPSNSIPMQLQYCSQDKMTELSRLSRFGMTFEPLTEDRGATLLTWYLAGSRAKMSAPQEKEMDLTENDPAFGQRWLGLLAKYDHDTFTWKTPQCSLVADSEEYLETWPAWGLMRNGESWERTTPVLRTCGTEFGLWPTPCATDSSDRKVDSGALHATKRGTFKHKGKSGTLSQIRLSQVVKHRTLDGVGLMRPEWVEWLMGWPIGHSALKPLETGRFQEWQQQHGACSSESE